MCMMADEDYWEFFNEFSPTARKEHRCCECGRTIAKGEKYCTQGGLHEGSFIWYKTCAHCNIASDWLVVACEGWVFGYRQQDLGDHVTGHEKYLRSRPLTRLYRWMLADWHDRSGELRPIDEIRAVTREAVAAYRAQHAAAVR